LRLTRENQKERSLSGQAHEIPVLGELNTILGGFSGGENSASKCK